MSDNEAAAPDPSNQLEESNTNQDSANPSFDESDSLLRLLVGGTLEGSDELRRRLQEWEQELADMANEPIEADDIQSMTQYVRIAFVGFLFSTKWQIDRAVPRLLRVADVLAKNSFRPLRPFVGNPFMQRVQSRFARLEKHGEDQVANWLAIGLDQEPRARILARYAVTDVVDELISQLAENPELEVLVQQQSVGLASEIVDGVRTQTVTADALMERSVRRILGRPARALPPGSDDVDQDGPASSPS